MKKQILVGLILCLVICLMANPVLAEEVSASGSCAGDVTWQLIGGTLTISGEGAMEKGESGSYGWEEYADAITSVVIEEGVTSVGYAAFEGCANLTEVELPESLLFMDGQAFKDCTGLECIDLPTTNELYIAEQAFYASGLTSIVLPDNVTDVEQSAFRNCENLTSAKLSNNMFENLRPYVFSGCSSLETVDFGTAVTVIDEYAFYGCGFRELTIPDQVTSINPQAFAHCTELVTLDLGDGVTLIWEQAFEWCSSLRTVKVGAGLERIYRYAFYHCEAIEEVYVDNLTHWCNVEVDHEDSSPVASADRLYVGGELVEDLVFPEEITTVAGYAFSGADCLKTVVFHDEFTTIGNAFSGCMNLHSVTIGDSVSTIGDGAFMDCEDLVSVVFRGSAPEFGGGNVFYNTAATIYYPAGDPTWTQEVMDAHWNGLEWVAYEDESEIPGVVPEETEPEETEPEETEPEETEPEETEPEETEPEETEPEETEPEETEPEETEPEETEPEETEPEETEPKPVTGEEYEPNDTIYNAQTMEKNLEFQGTLPSYCGDVDVYTFELTEETWVRFHVRNGRDTLDLLILNPQLQEVAKIPHLGTNKNGFEVYYGEVLLDAGTYYLGVFDFTGGSHGYFIRMYHGLLGGECTHEEYYTKVTTPATCVSEGEQLCTCNCGENWTEVIPVDGEAHTWDQGTVTTEATCTEDGVIHQTCTGCALEADNVIERSCQWDEGVVTREPTVDGYGVTLYTCTVCGGQMEEQIYPLRHGFIDVKPKSFCDVPIAWAVYKDVTKGMNDYTFVPGGNCTRGQVVTFLWRAAGCPEPNATENPFTDVQEGRFYYKAVLWAVENGITSGMTETTFRPDDTCTRGQVVTFLWRAAGKPAPVSGENPFTDVDTSRFYGDAVLWAVENGITSGMTDTTFCPNDSCTRGQVVTFLYRAFAK